MTDSKVKKIGNFDCFWYNRVMYNWSTDEKKFKKEDPKGYRLWRLEQLINFGLNGEKISRKELKKNWSTLKNKIDVEEKKLMEFFIWGKRYLPTTRKFFWEK